MARMTLPLGTIIALTVIAVTAQLNGELTGSTGITYSEKAKNTIVTDFLFDPPDHTEHYIHTRIYVQINISQDTYKYVNSYIDKGAQFYMGVKFDKNDGYLANMISVQPAPKMNHESARQLNMSYYLFWRLQLDNENNEMPKGSDYDQSRNGFIISANSIGYPKFGIQLVVKYPNGTDEVICSEFYHLKIIRKYRNVDLGFTITITIVGILNVFAIGCMTEIPVLRSQLKKSIIPVCIASGTQYIATPLLTFGLVKAAGILPEIAVGMLLCSCVPGGGLGHLIVLVTGNANTELSVALNLLQIFVPLGTVPLWLYSLGQFLVNGVGEVEVPTHFMVLCLALLLVPYLFGVILRQLKPSASEAMLNWLIKPMLLLFMILFVTLGLYINIYAMGVLDKVTLVIAGMIPSLGFCIGGGLTLVTKQGKASAKSVAIESAIMNCLAVVAAAKYTMPQPDSDMACAGAIAVLLFTIVPFIGMLIFHKIKKKVMEYFENRRYEKEHYETISKSFGLITQNALGLSGMAPSQINIRREEEDRMENMDKTLLSGEDSSEPFHTVVQIRIDGDNPSTETIALTQSNHRHNL